jgi:hypothetical protein
MKSTTLKIIFGALILCLASASAFAQGRGRGGGLGRKADVFTNGHDARIGRIDGRGRTQNWKCGVFVNCHDARDGRLDGRGPRVNAGNRIFAGRGNRVSYRRYSMNDYWQRRHLMSGTRYSRMQRFR